MDVHSDLQKVARALLDYAHGIHSRIPLCCIGAYIRGNSFYKSGADSTWHYAPCKSCLRSKHQAAIHYCNYNVKCRDNPICFVLDKLTEWHNYVLYPHWRDGVWIKLTDSVEEL